MENTTKIIFKGLVLLLAILFLLKNCSGCLDKVIPTVDTLTEKQNVIVKDIKQIDSNLVHVIERTKQDSVKRMANYNQLLKRYLKAIKQAPDTCKSYIDTIYGDALIIDLTDSISILRKDTVIKLLTNQIKNYKQITANDTIRLTQLSDSLRTERKSKKKYFKGLKHGFATGVLLSGAVYVGSILKP